jgi:hypothetical protein
MCNYVQYEISSKLFLSVITAGSVDSLVHDEEEDGAEDE